MGFSAFLISLLAVLPSTETAPVGSTTKDLYSCGYVLTKYNSSSFAGLYAHGSCKPFYYNVTIGDYQDAYAFRLYGGCECRFYEYQDGCDDNEHVPVYRNPTDGKIEDPLFEDPKPRWYDCAKMEE